MFTKHFYFRAALTLALAVTAVGCSSSRPIRFQLVDVESSIKVKDGSGILSRSEYSMFNRKGIKRLSTVAADANGDILIPGVRNHDIVLLSAPGHRFATVAIANSHRAEIHFPDPPLDPRDEFPAPKIVSLDSKSVVVVPMLRGEGEIPPFLRNMWKASE